MDIPDWYGSGKILTCLDYMTGFDIDAASELKDITPDLVARWDFVNFFAPFGIPKTIVVDTYGIFDWMFKNNIQETLLILVHAVAMGNHKEIKN